VHTAGRTVWLAVGAPGNRSRLIRVAAAATTGSSGRHVPRALMRRWWCAVTRITRWEVAARNRRARFPAPQRAVRSALRRPARPSAPLDIDGAICSHVPSTCVAAACSRVGTPQPATRLRQVYGESAEAFAAPEGGRPSLHVRVCIACPAMRDQTRVLMRLRLLAAHTSLKCDNARPTDSSHVPSFGTVRPDFRRARSAW
jgi:hypothetical protein